LKSIVCSFDWIPSSGSLKLLEMNTNVLLGGWHKPEDYLDFSALTTWCNSKSIEEVKIHANQYSWYDEDYLDNIIKGFSDEVQTKLSASLATQNISCSYYIDANSYPDDLTEIDSSTVLDLRLGTSANSKLDYMCINKDNLRGYLGSIGSGSLMSETGSSQIQNHNADGIPDYLWKITTRDQQLGVSFFESSSYSSSISNEINSLGIELDSGPRQGMAKPYIEKYYRQDNDKWGWFNEVHYVVVYTDDGTVIPLSTNLDNPHTLASFKRIDNTDYSKKDLKIINKAHSWGICGESTDIKLVDSPTGKTPIEIHSSSISLNWDEVKSAQIDSLDFDSEDYNTFDTRLGYYTSYTGSFNFVTGSNKFIFIPKYSENCVNIDDTILNGNALMPIKSGSSWQLKRASDVEASDVYLNSSLQEVPVTSSATTSNQVLVHPQPAVDFKYQRGIFCDDKLVFASNPHYLMNGPTTIQMYHQTGSISGSDSNTQHMNLLNENVNNGVLYNWSSISGSVKSYSENILTEISRSYTGSVWTW
jgi:hypothetical protein